MKPVWIAVIAIFSLMSATLHAQEDAGIGDADRAGADAEDAGASSSENAPSLLPATAIPTTPAVVQTHKLTPSDMLKLDPSLYSWQERRLIVSKQRNLNALYTAMVLEGKEYSAAKDARHQAMITGGVLLEVGGAASLVSSFIFAMQAALGGGFGGGCGGDMDEADQQECEADMQEEGNCLADSHEDTGKLVRPRRLGLPERAA